MRRVARTTTLLLFISLLVPFANGDQSLPLTFSNCQALGGGASLGASWGPNVNHCLFASSNTQSAPYHCLNQSSMNNCTGSCLNCNTKISVAANITMDNACISPTSLLWITTFYTGGGPHCGPRGEGC
jgi:hypothetical protein